MTLKVSMPGAGRYISSAGNLSNIASIFSNRKRANQRDQVLQLQQEALDYQRGAPQRAVEAEQALFDLTRQRQRDANMEQTNIVDGVMDAPYEAAPSVAARFAAPEGGEGPQQPLADGSASPYYSDMGTEFGKFKQLMQDRPELHRDPAEIRAGIAAAGRAQGMDEADIAAMQARGTERFTTLSPDAQKQAHDEAKTVAEIGAKIFTGGGSGNGSGGAGGQNIAGINAAATESFEQGMFPGGVDSYKGGFEEFLDAITPNFVASPDVARNEIDRVTGVFTEKTGIAKIHVLNAMLGTGDLRRDGNWDQEVSKLLADPEKLANIEMRARQHEAAANAKKGGVSQVERAAGLNTILQNFNDSNNAVRAGSVQTQNPLAAREQMADQYLSKIFGNQQPNGYETASAMPVSQSEEGLGGILNGLTADEAVVEAPEQVQPVKRKSGSGPNRPQPKASAVESASTKRVFRGGGIGSKASPYTAVPKKADVLSQTTKLFNSMTRSGKAAALQEAEARLQDPSTTTKERKQLIEILSLATQQRT